MKGFYKFILFLSLAISANAQTDANKGIEFYEKGDYQNAISALSKSEDIKDLHYLGLSYEKKDEINKAQEAYKKSFEKSYQLLFEKIGEWRKIEYTETKKSLSDLLKELKTAIDFGYASAEKAHKLESKIFQRNEWRIRARVLFDAKNLAASGETIYFRNDKNWKSLKITENGRPNYPDTSNDTLTAKDLNWNLPKTVTLFVVFGADGKIKLLMPADEKINSFTFSAIKAAEKIKFQPAEKDGKAVTTHNLMVYTFSIG